MLGSGLWVPTPYVAFLGQLLAPWAVPARVSHMARPHLRHLTANRSTVNSFCPTGQGGGIDPSCGADGSSGSDASGKIPMHDIKVPKSGKLTIDQAHDAMKQMGYKQIGSFDKGEYETPDGKVVKLSVKQIKDAVMTGARNYQEAAPRESVSDVVKKISTEADAAGRDVFKKADEKRARESALRRASIDKQYEDKKVAIKAKYEAKAATSLKAQRLARQKAFREAKGVGNCEYLVANLSVGKVRRETMGGRKYLVAPLTLIVPGVLNGSRGPLFYPEDEVAKNFDAWNNVPITVGHPKTEGRHVSARDPEVLDKQGIGVVLKANVRGRLRAEGWFDAERTRQVDKRIYEALVKNKPIELSTGLFTENEPAPSGANHKGKSYSFIARNYKPDHLAVLPDQVGACSIRDGCGVNVNQGGGYHAGHEGHASHEAGGESSGTAGVEESVRKAVAGGNPKIAKQKLRDYLKGKTSGEMRKAALYLRDKANSSPGARGRIYLQSLAKVAMDKSVEASAREQNKSQRTSNKRGIGACSIRDGCGVNVNAFCPNGEGGGVDPSCGKGGEGGESGSGERTDIDSLRSMLGKNEYGNLSGTKELGSISVTAYRVGGKDKFGRGTFYSGDRAGAEAYVSLHPGEEVQEYQLRLKNVLLAGHQNDVSKLFFKKTYGEVIDALSVRAKSEVVGGQKFDVKVAKEAKKRGYDAIVYLRPAPPATSEVAVFNQQNKDQRTSNKQGESDMAKTKQKLSEEKREEMIVNLLSCNDCGYDEDDREVLENFSDEKLQKVANYHSAAKKNFKTAKEQEAVVNSLRETLGDGAEELTLNAMPAFIKEKIAAKEGKEGEETPCAEDDQECMDKMEANKKKAATKNQKPMTEDEWKKSAPASVLEDLKFAANERAKQKKTLIDRLTRNVEDDEAKTKLTSRLESKGIEELTDLLALAPEAKAAEGGGANYGGLAAPVGNVDFSKGDRGEGLGIPVLNFEDNRRKTA